MKQHLHALVARAKDCKGGIHGKRGRAGTV
jgi:hypothetical protein